MRDKIKDFLAARGVTEGDLGADGQFAETSPSAADFDLLEANLRIPPSSYSLLGLLDEIYQDYADSREHQRLCAARWPGQASRAYARSVIDWAPTLISANSPRSGSERSQSSMQAARISSLNWTLVGVELLRDREDFVELYPNFFELSLTGAGSATTISHLHALVRDELGLANHRVQEFNVADLRYSSGYTRPSTFTHLDRQLHEIRKLWTEVVVRVDGLGTLALCAAGDDIEVNDGQ
ncbi:hypothetical protein B0H13DRAFT_1864754 [Mycena leptocephala]|nr:hypothetical protein B0H13DRAFT_1864754 [Mycena leptocephala]